MKRLTIFDTLKLVLSILFYNLNNFVSNCVFLLFQWQTLISWLPNRIALQQPFRLFSTDEDGYRYECLQPKCVIDTFSMSFGITTSRLVHNGGYIQKLYQLFNSPEIL